MQPMSKVSPLHKLLFSVLALAFFFAFSSCVEQRDLSENVVIVHVSSDPDGLHPINDNSANRSFIFKYTHNCPAVMDLDSLSPRGDVCYYPPEISEDKLKYTWTVKPGITWDDGSPLTAEDVAFTLKVWQCPLADNGGLRTVVAQIIKDIYVHPDDPMKFIMEAHDVHIDNMDIMVGLYLVQKSKWDPEGVLDKYTIPIFQSSDFDKDADEKLTEWANDFNDENKAYVPEQLIGLGPYQVTDYVVNNYVTLERKENWWGDDNEDNLYWQNFPDKIIFKIIKDDAAAYLSLKNQNIDVTTRLGTSRLLKLQKLNYFNDNYHSDFVDQYGYSYIGLNMKPDGIEHKPFFTDKKVRRAMAHLVPVDEIIEVIAFGKAIRQVSNVSPLKRDYADHLELIQLDVEKAKELLSEAGWEDTDGNNIRDKVVNGEKLQFSFKLNYFAGASTSREIALMIQEEMYKAGVECTPNPVDFSLMYSNAQEHKYDAMMAGWSSSSAPDNMFQIWHHSNWVNKGYNFTGFGNAYTDSLIEASNKIIDMDERRKVMLKLQEIVYDEQTVHLHVRREKEDRDSQAIHQCENVPRASGCDSQLPETRSGLF